MVSRSGASLFGGQALAGLCLALAVAGSAAASSIKKLMISWRGGERQGVREGGGGSQVAAASMRGWVTVEGEAGG